MKLKFLRDRFFGVFDNLLGVAILYLLSIILSKILNWGLYMTLLVLLIIGQVFVLLLLFSIHRATSSPKQKAKLLVKNADTNVLYLIDQYGLPHPINDEDTALYLVQMLGYQDNEIPQVMGSSLKPEGSVVTAYRQWHPPRTKEDEKSNEARRSLKCVKKYVRTESGLKVISFDIRNDGDPSIQINSAKLTFDTDAPLSINDISPKNKPISSGVLYCRLLFNGESESRRISSQEEVRLDLFLKRTLSTSEAETLATARFGHIEFSGKLEDIQISFFIYV